MSVPTIVALAVALVLIVLFIRVTRKFPESWDPISSALCAAVLWVMFVTIYTSVLERNATVVETGKEVTVNIEIEEGEYMAVVDGKHYFFVKDDAGVVHPTNYPAEKVIVYTGSIVERPQLVVKEQEKVYEVPFDSEVREEYPSRVVVGIP